MSPADMPYTDRFVQAVEIVLMLEGGGQLVDDPDDRGKTTRWGISQRANPDIDIVALSKERAMQIYHERYWKPIRGDELPTDGLALFVFDTAVLGSPRSAAVTFQRALMMPADKVDGVIGEKTLAFARERVDSRVRELVLLIDMAFARVSRYARIVRSDPTQSKFIVGWTNRVADVVNRSLALTSRNPLARD